MMDKRSLGGLMPSSSSVYNNPFSTTSVISSPTSGGGGERIRDGTRNNNGVNPSQIQDHHHHHNHHQHHHRQQQQQQPIREPIDPPPDPDPVPVSIALVGAPSSPIAGGSTTLLRRTTSNETKSTPTIRYRECLKNHAASIGGHVVDGCGEFMPSGEDGTREALKCAACDCHRNFHRKEVDGEPQSGHNCYYCYNPNKADRGSRVPPPPITATPTLVPAPLQQHQNKFQFGLPPTSPPSGPIQPMMMTFGGGGGGVTDQSSSEELNVFHSSGTGAGHPPPPSFGGSKKRFRTKFSQEQKDKMLEFAEKIGWRIQKQDEAEVQQFCAEVGVKRQVLKVWMHNNKHAMKKKELE